MFLETPQNSQENTCEWVSFLMKLQVEASKFIKKKTLAHVFSSESSRVIEVIRTAFIFIFIFLWKNSKHLKHKQKHLKQPSSKKQTWKT